MNIKYFDQETYKDILSGKMTDLINTSFRPASEVILDDTDLRNFLKISRRTSLEWRNNGKLRFYKMGGGKIYYILAEILEDIKKHY